MATQSSSHQLKAFAGDEQQRDVRSNNIMAAKAVADTVRTSLGPKGMDKMITTSSGEVIITNDGATILSKLDVVHPAAKMMCDLSTSQDVEAGDGTTTVVVIAGALLDTSRLLLERGVHPSVISDAFLVASHQAETILKEMAIPLELNDRDTLVKATSTSLNSKVVSDNSSLLAPLAVDAVLRVAQKRGEEMKEETYADLVDLNNIKVVKKLGGTIEDTELVNGLVFDTHASHKGGGPSRMKGAKIALIQFCLSAPKTDMDNSVVVSDYMQMDRILKEERKYILNMIKVIVKSGCNLLLIQKSILRDAVNDLALHYLAKKKIMVVKDIERNEVEFIAKTLGCRPIAHLDQFKAEALGHAELCEEVSTPSGKIVKITGVANEGKTVTVLCRGSNRLVLDESERSIHDALCVVRSLVKENFLLPGGSAPEMEVCVKLEKLAATFGGQKGYCISKYAQAFEVIPYTLAENAGLNPIDIVTELRKRHGAGESNAGINIKKGKVENMVKLNVIQPLLVTLSAIKLATETIRTILKIDDIVAVR